MTIIRLNESGQRQTPLGVDFGFTGLSTLTPYSLIGGDTADPKKLIMLGTGNTGQTLAGFNDTYPVWTDSDRVSAFQQLSNQTVSAGASVVNVTNLTGWDEYRILFTQMDISAAAQLYFRMSINNGVAYLSGTNYSYSIWSDGTPLSGAVGQAQIAFNPGGNMSSTAGLNNSILVRLFNLSAGHCGLMWKMKYVTGTTGIMSEGGADLTGNAGVVNAIRFLLSTGTFDGGIVTAWGLKT